MKQTPKKFGTTVSGFTLIELLVVITIILILAGILIPVANNALVKARMTTAMNSAKQIYTAVFEYSLEGDENYFPQTKGSYAFDNSTDLWKSMVTNEVLDVDFSFFGAAGLPRYGGVDPDRFTPEHNAWCVTADLSLNAKNNAPLFFTRNLEILNIEETGLKDRVADVNPFGFHGVVVAFKGGQASVMKLHELEERFNPHELDKPVLRPTPAQAELSWLAK